MTALPSSDGREVRVVGAATVFALVGAVVVALLAVRAPADGRRVLRLGAAAIVVLTAGLLTAFTVADSGAAAVYLLGTPVAVALLPPLARRTAVDLLAGLLLGAWALLLGLGVGVAFLPPALLLLGVPAVAPPAPVSRRRPLDPRGAGPG